MNESALLGLIEQICQDLGWKKNIQLMSGNTIVLCPLKDDIHFDGVLFVISAPVGRLVMYVSYRTKVSAKYRTVMAKTITQINSGLLGGCLEMNTNLGEVRYRDGIFIVADNVDLKLLQTLVATTLRDAMNYSDSIESVIKGDCTAGKLFKLKKD